MVRRGGLQVYHEFEECEGAPGQAQAARPAGQEECQAWLARLCAQWESRSQDALFKLLRGSSGKAGDRTIKIVNQARACIGKAFSFSSSGQREPEGAPNKARCSLYLYYRTLFKLLRRGVDDVSDDGGADPAPKLVDAVVKALLEDNELQIGLVNACIEVVNFAFLEDPAEAFPHVTWAKLDRLGYALELWQGVDWVVELGGAADEAAGMPAMPEALRGYLGAVQTRIEEELAFANGSSIYTRMLAMGACADGGEENDSSAMKKRRKMRLRPCSDAPGSALMSRFLTNLTTTAMARSMTVCRELQRAHGEELAAVADLSGKVGKVVDIVLYEHLWMLFGTPLSVTIACCIYFVLRLHGVVFSFRKLTSHMAATLLNHSEETFSQIEIAQRGSSTAGGDCCTFVMGDTREFYNSIFLPEMEGHSASDLFGDEASATSSQRSSPSLAPPAGAEAVLPPLRPLRPLRWQELEAPQSQGPSACEDLPGAVAAAAPPALAAATAAAAGAAASMGAKAGAGEKGKGRKGERASGSGARRPLGQVDRNQAAQG